MIYVQKWKVPQIEVEYTRQWNFDISSFENAFDGWARRSMELRNFEELLRNQLGYVQIFSIVPKSEILYFLWSKSWF